MSRRRLRVVHDSSSEDEDSNRPPPRRTQQQLQFDDEDDIEVELQESTTNLRSVTLNPPNPNPGLHPTPSMPVQIDISDDDFVDIPEDFSTPSPPSPPPPPPPPPPPAPPQQPFPNSNTSRVTNTSSFEVSDSQVGRFFENVGLRLRRDWLDPCVAEMENSLPGFRSMDVAGKAKLCFGQFLYSDMNQSGAGVLPDNVHAMHLVDLPGPFILQVDEIVNITRPLKGRYVDAPPGDKRCLKLCMTDGVQQVFGIEYRRINDLQVLAPAGLKVAIRNVNIRRGMLMLVPEVLEVLGGVVEDLEAARERVVKEVNKSPRGKRTRSGEVPPLSTRATLAAWPPHSPDGPRQTDRSFAQAAAPTPNVAAGPSYHANTPRHSSIPSSQWAAPVPNIPAPSFASTPGHNSSPVTPPTVLRLDTPNGPGQTFFAQAAAPLPNAATGPSNHVNTPTSSNIPSSHWAAPVPNTPACPPSRASAPPRVPHFSENSYPPDRVNASRNTTSPIAETSVSLPNVAACPPDRVNTPRQNSSPLSGFEAPLRRTGQGGVSGGISTEERHIEDLTIPSSYESKPSSVPLSDVEDIHMVDQVELPFAVSADEENPFTYLASLSAKCAAEQDKSKKIQGKIKCFLTGVKGFQYKRRDTFELRVYVDDGSLISEILIDHNVVQRGIGHSPREVTAGLTSPDSRVVSDMKEKLKQFQLFLANFEGRMVVEMSGSCGVPVVIEMEQGCPPSDAWLLLTRMQLRQPAQQQQPDHISVSP